ncbi:MAG: hypothetical protein R2759_05605 [Bacteroidales bacterium]
MIAIEGNGNGGLAIEMTDETVNALLANHLLVLPVMAILSSRAILIIRLRMNQFMNMVKVLSTLA